LTWENVEDESPRARHQEGASRSKMIELAGAVAVGDLARVELEPCLAGYF
jgi:hypothetical protein